MLDPIGGFLRIRNLFLDYLDTAFRIRDPEIAKERRALLEQNDTLRTDPLLEPVPRYRHSEHYLHELANSPSPNDPLGDMDSKERVAFTELALSGLLFPCSTLCWPARLTRLFSTRRANGWQRMRTPTFS